MDRANRRENYKKVLYRRARRLSQRHPNVVHKIVTSDGGSTYTEGVIIYSKTLPSSLSSPSPSVTHRNVLEVGFVTGDELPPCGKPSVCPG